MTAQEVEKWTQRLRKIWESAGFDFIAAGQVEQSGTFNFRHRTQDDTSLHVLVFEGVQAYVFLRTGDITLYWEDDVFVLIPESSTHVGNLHDPRAAPWLPMFRRCCWLSGCPIEATAHEKAEWSQSFTAEEIEAWNLTL